VRAVQGVMVNNEVAGQVRTSASSPATGSAPGQALVQLDTTVDEAELGGLVATLELAETKLKRNTKLLRDRAVSQGDFDETNAQLTLARAAVASKQALIEKKTIRAPFDGVLGIRQIDLGQYLPEGSAIVALEALDPVFVDYALPERHLAKLATRVSRWRCASRPTRSRCSRAASGHQPGRGPGHAQRAACAPSLPTPTAACAPACSPRCHAAAATRAGADAAAARGVLQHLRRLGVRDRGSQRTRRRTTLRRQPRPATEPQLTVTRRQIVTGSVRGDEVEVIEGLAAGDRVVLAGHQKLRNGAEVQIVPG
jgi:membrane fusion protein (multidrug efflux system)